MKGNVWLGVIEPDINLPPPWNSPWIFINRLFNADVTKCNELAEKAWRRYERTYIKGTQRATSVLLSSWVTHSYTTGSDLEIQFDSAWNESGNLPLVAVRRTALLILSVWKCDWRIRRTRVCDRELLRFINLKSFIDSKIVYRIHFLYVYMRRDMDMVFILCRKDVGFFTQTKSFMSRRSLVVQLILMCLLFLRDTLKKHGYRLNWEIDINYYSVMNNFSIVWLVTE